MRDLRRGPAFWAYRLAGRVGRVRPHRDQPVILNDVDRAAAGAAERTEAGLFLRRHPHAFVAAHPHSGGRGCELGLASFTSRLAAARSSIAAPTDLNRVMSSRSRRPGFAPFVS